MHALEPELPLIQFFSGRETSESIQARLDAVAQYAVGVGPSKTDVDAARTQAAKRAAGAYADRVAGA